jgi:hypothetical protein
MWGVMVERAPTTHLGHEAVGVVLPGLFGHFAVFNRGDVGREGECLGEGRVGEEGVFLEVLPMLVRAGGNAGWGVMRGRSMKGEREGG